MQGSLPIEVKTLSLLETKMTGAITETESKARIEILCHRRTWFINNNRYLLKKKQKEKSKLNPHSIQGTVVLIIIFFFSVVFQKAHRIDSKSQYSMFVSQGIIKNDLY